MKISGTMTAAVALAGAMAWGGAATAQGGGAYVVSKDTLTSTATRRVSVMPGLQPNTRVVVRPVLNESAVVDPALAATPTFPNQVKLVYANTTAVYLDPANAGFIYSTDGVDHIDHNHSLLRALRVANAQGAGSYVATRVERSEAERSASTMPRPIFRLRKPNPATAPQPVAMVEETQ